MEMNIEKIVVLFGEINNVSVKKSFLIKKSCSEEINKIVSEINGLSNILGVPEPIVEYGNKKLVSLINKSITSSINVSRNLSRPLRKLVFTEKEKRYKFIDKTRCSKNLQQKNKIFVGFDIGGTFVKSAAFNNRRIISDSCQRAVVPLNRNEAVPFLIKLFLKTIKGLNKNNIAGVGIGIPGFAVSGTIVKMSNLPSWHGLTIVQSMGKELFGLLDRKIPVLVDNDANLAGLRNAIKFKKPNSITLTIGTGVGGGVVVDNKIFHGESGAAGEMHFVLPFIKDRLVPEISCSCGVKSLCIESLCSSRGIVIRTVKLWKKSADKNKSNVLTKIVSRVNNQGTIKNDDCRMIAELAVNGNRIANDVFKETAELLFEGMKYLHKITGINEYVLTGGVVQGKTGTLLQKHINAKIKINKNIKLTIAKDKNTAGAEGAAMLAETRGEH